MTGNLMSQTYFEVFHSLLVERTYNYWRSITERPWLPIFCGVLLIVGRGPSEHWRLVICWPTILHTSHQSEILHSLIFERVFGLLFFAILRGIFCQAVDTIKILLKWITKETYRSSYLCWFAVCWHKNSSRFKQKFEVLLALSHRCLLSIWK